MFQSHKQVAVNNVLAEDAVCAVTHVPHSLVVSQ